MLGIPLTNSAVHLHINIPLGPRPRLNLDHHLPERLLIMHRNILMPSKQPRPIIHRFARKPNHRRPHLPLLQHFYRPLQLLHLPLPLERMQHQPQIHPSNPPSSSTHGSSPLFPSTSPCTILAPKVSLSRNNSYPNSINSGLSSTPAKFPPGTPSNTSLRISCPKQFPMSSNFPPSCSRRGSRGYRRWRCESWNSRKSKVPMHGKGKASHARSQRAMTSVSMTEGGMPLSSSRSWRAG